MPLCTHEYSIQGTTTVVNLMVGRPPLITSDERRRRVLESATTVFAASGFDTATVDEIGRRSGVSKPAIYRDFPSKAHLYAAVIEQHASERATAAIQAFSAPGTIEFRLHAMIDAWFAEVEANPTLYRLASQAVPNDPVIAQVVAARHAIQVAHDVALIRAFAPHIPESEIEPIGEVVRGALVSLATWWVQHPESPRTTPVAAMMRLCNGIRSAPSND